MNHYMRLSDDTLIQIEAGAALDHIVHIAADEAAAVSVCRKIIPANLSYVEFLQDKEVIGSYNHLQLRSAPTRSTNEDETITVVISLRERTTVEARLDALEASQTTQDGAIEDLGAAVSDISEAMEA